MDAAEFKRRYMPYHEMLYRVAYGLTQHQQDAEDLLQDVYLRLWRRRDRLPAESASAAYLTRVINNLYVEQQRTKRIDIKARLSDSQSPPDNATPERLLQSQEETQRLNSLIAHLPDNERRVVEAKAIEERNNKEIERDTGLSPSNIRQLWARGKKKLRFYLKE